MKGKKLIFISQIKRKGNGVIKLKGFDMSIYDEDYFTLNCLSITEKTYIASGFNTFVVKLK